MKKEPPQRLGCGGASVEGKAHTEDEAGPEKKEHPTGVERRPPKQKAMLCRLKTTQKPRRAEGQQRHQPKRKDQQP